MSTYDAWLEAPYTASTRDQENFYDVHTRVLMELTIGEFYDNYAHPDTGARKIEDLIDRLARKAVSISDRGNEFAVARCADELWAMNVKEFPGELDDVIEVCCANAWEDLLMGELR